MNSTSVFKSNSCCKSFTLYWKRFNCIPYRTCCYFSGPLNTREAMKLSYYNCVLKLVILRWISKVLLYVYWLVDIFLSIGWAYNRYGPCGQASGVGLFDQRPQEGTVSGYDFTQVHFTQIIKYSQNTPNV